MDDEVKAADVYLCTGSSNPKEISSSAAVEAVEEAGNSPSPFSASEEEGVSRSAEQTNSDAYLADASSLMSSDDSDSKLDGADFVDFNLPWRKKKSLLERIKDDEELTPPSLKDLISAAVKAKVKEASTEAAGKGEQVSVEAIKEELVNQVDDRLSEHGYGAIHYITKGNYTYKTELLVVMAIHGNADLDLTTTNRDQMTALHLAIEVNDKECVKTLISLGADFNKGDSMGRTPLDFARIIARGGRESNVQMKEFEVGQKMVIGEEMIIERGLTRTVEITSSFHFESQQSITSEQPMAEGENMADLLISIGATTGSSKSREDQLLSSLVAAAARHTTSSLRDLSPEPKEDIATGSIENGFDSENYCASYKVLDSRISERLHDLSHTLTPEESLELVGDMRKREQFRRKYGSRILCLDGGGIRGLVTLSILQEIERKMNKKITEIFDWIVGTSTGGIIALGLCYGPEGDGKSVRQLRNLYWAKKNDVFGSTHVLLKKFEMTSKELESTLKEWLGENVYMRKMSECDSTKKPKPRVLIPAVHKKSNVELHFYNDCFHNDYSGELAWKVARYTSANFLYFTEFEGYVDGGVLANNPAEEGLTAIQDHYHERGEKLPISLLVSVGTGVNPSKEIGSINVSRLQVINPKRWKNLLELLASVMAVMNKRVHSNCECRCREQGIDYFRFNPELDNGVDSGQIQTKILLSMLWETKKYLHKEKEKMDKLVELLSKSSFSTPHCH